MIDIEIHNDDREKAVEVLKYKNFGNRSSGFNGNYEKQYTGLIGDLTVHRLLEMDPPNYNEGRIDTDILVNNKKIEMTGYTILLAIKKKYPLIFYYL